MTTEARAFREGQTRATFHAWTTDYARLSWLAVGIGALCYLFHYIGGRSLWLDEAMLALNIKLLTPSELTGKLDYFQLAPVGWLLSEKAIYEATHSLEYGLRLLPVASAIAALAAFRSLALKAIGGAGAVAATLVFALSPVMIRYAAEAKPYGSDVLMVVLTMLTSWTLIKDEKAGFKPFAPWALTGFATVALSFPGIYALASCGVAVFLALALKRRWGAAAVAGVIGAAWLAAFLFLFLTVYSPQLKGSDLVSGGSANFFARTSYAPLPPKSVHDVLWYVEWAKGYLEFLVRPEGLYPGALLLALGIWSLARRQWLLLVISLGALVFALIGSGLKLYPLYERLALFAAPGVWLVIGAGATQILAASRGARLGAALVVALVVLGGGSYVGGNLLKVHPPFAQHHVRPALAKIAQDLQPGDVIYVANNAIPAYLLYRSEFGLNRRSWIEGKTPQVSWSCFMQEAPEVARPYRMWVLFTFNDAWDQLDKPFDEYLTANGRIGSIKQIMQLPSAYLYRVDTTPLPGWNAATKPQYPCALKGTFNRFDAPPRLSSRLED